MLMMFAYWRKKTIQKEFWTYGRHCIYLYSEGIEKSPSLDLQCYFITYKASRTKLFSNPESEPKVERGYVSRRNGNWNFLTIRIYIRKQKKTMSALSSFKHNQLPSNLRTTQPEFH